MADKDLKIKISGDASGFGKAANQVTREINGIRDNIRNLPSEAVKSAGAQLAAFFSVDFLVSQVKQTMEYAGAIQDMADKVGVGTEFLQEMDYAAEQTGASLQDFVLSLREVQRSQAAALADMGGKDAKWFKAIGVSLAEIGSLKPEELWTRVAEAIQKGKQGGAQMEAAIQLLGRSALNVLPAMRAGFLDLAKDARTFGAVIENDTIARLDAMGDRIAALKRASRGLAVNNPIAEHLIGKAEQQVLGATGITAAISGAMKAAFSGKNPITGAVDAFKAARDSALRPPGSKERSTLQDVVPKEEKPKASAALSNAGINADALQRIGLFISGASIGDIQRRQLTYLERLYASNQEAVRLLRKGLI